ncbi:hypothetical protein MVEN_01511000 [Mycena venus]|uniref:F-box domain-containing protein n=1 Tax=Mycena venus TaxID=2733690 RepID=A0A8H7CTJ7_9AGAR|nr:hypothetical protein MVEN_01511000 [Mycena venus]
MTRKVKWTNGRPERRVKKPDKKTGSLARVLQMPLDVLFEILGFLDPQDILVLARLTRSIRRLLMHRSAICVWKAARGNVPGFPDPPSDMSEPAYANLAFSRHCHYCLTKGVKQIHWRQRLRLCTLCTNSHLVKNKYEDLGHELDLAVPRDVHRLILNMIPTRRVGPDLHFLAKDYEDAKTTLQGFRDPLALAAFISESTGRVQEIDQHAGLCETWVKERSDVWAEHLKKLEATRVQDVKDKLKALGYDIDAEEFSEYFNVPPIKQPQPLTPRVWNRFKHVLLVCLEDEKLRKKAEERKAAFLSSKSFALSVLRRFHKSRVQTLCTDDLAAAKLRESSTLIHNMIQSPLTSAIKADDPSFAEMAEDLVHGLFDEWRNTVQDHLLTRLGDTTRGSQFSSGDDPCSWTFSEPTSKEGLRRLSLATTVFTCECSKPEITAEEIVSSKPAPIDLSRMKPLFFPASSGPHMHCAHPHHKSLSGDPDIVGSRRFSVVSGLSGSTELGL